MSRLAEKEVLDDGDTYMAELAEEEPGEEKDKEDSIKAEFVSNYTITALSIETPASRSSPASHGSSTTMHR